jgi:hypothetical protein
VAAETSSVSGATAVAPDTASKPRRRPPWVWAIPFAAVFILVVARNAFLFSTSMYEQGDSGANSILIQQALRFRLLVGNYSREGFNHPGPAYMYIEAAGQWLGRDVLRLVPTDWNGQFLAVYALDASLLGLAVLIVFGWAGLRGAAAAFGVLLGFAALHPTVLTSNWMPNLYVMSFFVFLIAASSVAARQSRDLWVMALTGWLLIHGHACFLFFVPLITAATLVIAAWPDRRHLLTAIRSFVQRHRGLILTAVLISVVFLTPIVINLVLHWPGDFGKYFGYGNSSQAGHHTLHQVVLYALWYWWPHHHAWIFPLVGYPAALASAGWLTRGRLRRCLLTLIAMTVVTSAGFFFYTAVGIDHLTETYIGYFYWAVPAALALVIAVSVISAIRVTAFRVTAAILVAATAVFAVFAALGGLRSSTVDNDPLLPGAVRTLAADSHGRIIAIDGRNAAWVELPGFLVQAERTGVRTCVYQPGTDEVIVTKQFTCTQQEWDAGARYEFLATAPPSGAQVLTRMGNPTFGYAAVVRG